MVQGESKTKERSKEKKKDPPKYKFLGGEPKKHDDPFFFLRDQDDVIHRVKSKRRSIVMCKT